MKIPFTSCFTMSYPISAVPILSPYIFLNHVKSLVGSIFIRLNPNLKKHSGEIHWHIMLINPSFTQMIYFMWGFPSMGVPPFQDPNGWYGWWNGATPIPGGFSMWVKQCHGGTSHSHSHHKIYVSLGADWKPRPQSWLVNGIILPTWSPIHFHDITMGKTHSWNQ